MFDEIAFSWFNTYFVFRSIWKTIKSLAESQNLKQNSKPPWLLFPKNVHQKNNPWRWVKYLHGKSVAFISPSKPSNGNSPSSPWPIHHKPFQKCAISSHQWGGISLQIDLINFEDLRGWKAAPKTSSCTDHSIVRKHDENRGSGRQSLAFFGTGDSTTKWKVLGDRIWR